MPSTFNEFLSQQKATKSITWKCFAFLLLDEIELKKSSIQFSVPFCFAHIIFIVLTIQLYATLVIGFGRKKSIGILRARRNHFILKCKSNYWPRDAFVSHKLKFHEIKWNASRQRKTKKHREVIISVSRMKYITPVLCSLRMNESNPINYAVFHKWMGQMPNDMFVFALASSTNITLVICTFEIVSGRFGFILLENVFDSIIFCSPKPLFFIQLTLSFV